MSADERDAGPSSTEKREKTPVSQYGNKIQGAGNVATVTLGMVVLALFVGFVVGFLVWAALWASSAVTSLVWSPVNSGQAAWYIPLVICAGGGLLIGLWTKFVGGQPRPLEEVLADVKRDGSYHLKSIPASVVGFLMPLAFGGSVGMEAGLTGLIAAASSWISETLKRAGLKVKGLADVTVSASLTAIFGAPFAGIVAAAEDAMPEQDRADDNRANPVSAANLGSATNPDSNPNPNLDPNPNPDNYTLRRRTKLVLYTAAAIGAVGGIEVLNAVVGGVSGLPRFDAIYVEGAGYLWFVPCLAVAYVLGLVYHVGDKFSRAVGARLGKFTVLAPIICGILLGLVALVLPNALFCGEEQAQELMGTWQATGVMVLFATAFVKVVLTSLCLNMGWMGGVFFPNIYAGVSCGYGFALLTGADPVFCVTVITSAYLAVMLRRPLLPLALLVLCFPVRGILWMGLACVLGAALPVPRVLLAKAKGE